MTISATSSSPDVGRDRHVLAVVDDYREAEAINKRLADGDFPVERTRIVENDLQGEESATAPLTLWKAIVRGALGGALAGMLICWLFTLFSWLTPVADLLLVVYGSIDGAVIGEGLGAIGYALTRIRPDSISERTPSPTRYEVHVDTASAPEARRILKNEGPDMSGVNDGGV